MCKRKYHKVHTEKNQSLTNPFYSQTVTNTITTFQCVKNITYKQDVKDLIEAIFPTDKLIFSVIDN